MRVYWPISIETCKALENGDSVSVDGIAAVSATEGFAHTLETSDQDELDLMAALAASDLGSSQHAVAVGDLDAQVVDNELGEVVLKGTISYSDIACLLIADVEAQELSWFGIQEIEDLAAALQAKGK
jgi:hypothetical protein